MADCRIKVEESKVSICAQENRGPSIIGSQKARRRLCESVLEGRRVCTGSLKRLEMNVLGTAKTRAPLKEKGRLPSSSLFYSVDATSLLTGAAHVQGGTSPLCL